jgi:hypothetical protein
MGSDVIVGIMPQGRGVPLYAAPPAHWFRDKRTYFLNMKN